MRKLIMTLPAFILAGCSSSATYSICTTANVETELKGYSKAHEYKHVVINEITGLGTVLCEQFEKAGVRCLTDDQLFSPLESFTPKQKRQTLRDNDIDALVLIKGNAEHHQIASSGSYSVSNGYGTFNTAGESTVAQTNGVSATFNVNQSYRSLSVTYSVFETKDFTKVYEGTANTYGSGSKCIENTVFFRSQGEALIKELKQNMSSV